ncbi:MULTISPECIES: class I SAM-dependent methyltransferase [unclassified Halanaerobium]|uniref:tRNA (mnm(5)s(2)U34)-methyltransferase n=1 Tax=unclassified Halanaerobium TaxID=2641197 RepID=UPI000DF41E58|nr:MULTISPECIES: class I SAM-dependent methyltransferase [unclassified Halanaerobium]RCW51523.1 putative rRNA methylase [Halanaerobium sp. MA284_MarDTE_T2]RCW89311.1 putative rRNA methylase [Halanaerobium sp. DL-01]
MNNDFLTPVEFSHFLLNKHVQPGDTAVDATAGNGYDTLFLAELVKEKGTVYSFDIQDEAVANTIKLLNDYSFLDRVRIFNDSHENIDNYLEETNVSAVIFNLGYLPGGDKTIKTKASSTVTAVKKSMNFLKKGGIIVLVVYSGHRGGVEEKEAVLNFLKDLNYKRYNVIKYSYLNQPDFSPELLALIKR